LEPIRIAVDAMGGDLAPAAAVQGAVMATREMRVPLTLVGNKDVINRELAGLTFDPDLLTIVHCSQVAEMGDSPIEVIRKKKDASIRVAIDLAKKGEVQGVVSAGNSGATMAISAVVLGKLPGVERPALGALFPSHLTPTFLIDVGANVDCSAYQLLQFAIMAETMARYILKRSNPRVGLLSIGEEESKGNDLVRLTSEGLRKIPLNFIGNVEGRDLFSGKADVIVCDGFVGNICLKLSEGLAEALGAMLKEELGAGLGSKIGLLLLKSGFKSFFKRVDYATYGGVPLLGVNGVVVIGHGSSGPRAVMNAIGVAYQAIQQRINDHLQEGLKHFEPHYRKIKPHRFWDAFKMKKHA
jgi:phosphate acyltransferase